MIKSIDRLGRNYKMIIEEWHRITKEIEADIVVIDMPLLDTRNEEKNLVGRFISDIVLQILSFVAENERENIKSRQAEGIRLARLNGKHLGRPSFKLPHNSGEIFESFAKSYITRTEAIKLLGTSNATFYKYMRIYCKKNNIECK